MPAEESCNCGWVKLYHPRGPLVTLPVLTAKADYQAMFLNVSAALDAGFLENAPGLETGESRIDVVAVVRMTKENRDRSESPMIALYEHGNAFKTVTVYLDTEEQIGAFLFASGLKSLTEIPLLDGTTAPERGKSKSADAKVLVLSRPMPTIVAPNPRFDKDKAAKATQADPYTVPKTIFVRWFDSKAPAAASVGQGLGWPNASGERPTDDQVLATWDAFLKGDPPVGELNARLKRDVPSLAEELKKRVWGRVKQHATAANLVWSQQDAGYKPAA